MTNVINMTNNINRLANIVKDGLNPTKKICRCK